MNIAEGVTVLDVEGFYSKCVLVQFPLRVVYTIIMQSAMLTVLQFTHRRIVVKFVGVSVSAVVPIWCTAGYLRGISVDFARKRHASVHCKVPVAFALGVVTAVYLHMALPCLSL